MKTCRHSGQCRHRFTLAARRDQYRVFFLIIFQMLYINQRSFRNIDISQFTGRSDDIDHASAFHNYFSSVFVSRIDNLLYTVHIRGKGSHKNPVVLMLGKNGIKGPSHRPLRHRKSRPDGIGTVTHKGQHTFFAKLCKPLKIGRLTEYRRVVNFKVSRVENNACRRKNSQGRCVRDTVVCLYKFDPKAAQIN